MKRLVLFVLPVLILAACAPAATSTIPMLAPISYSQILIPSDNAIQAQCDKHYTNPNLATTDNTATFINYPRVVFQTPLGSVASVCSSKAKSFQAKPSLDELKSLGTFFALGGRVSSLDEARRFAAALVVKDGQGNEVARLLPSEEGSQVASLSNWDVSCGHYNGCRWYGSNYYYFDTADASFRESLTAANSVFVMFQRQGQFEQRQVPTTMR